MTTADQPTYCELMHALRERGVSPELIAARLGVATSSLNRLRTLDTANPRSETYQRLARLARACRKAYGTTA